MAPHPLVAREAAVNRALLLVDVIKAFEHEDGDRLLESFRSRHATLVEALEQARAGTTPVFYANDADGTWDDAAELVRRALEGKGGDLIAAVTPRPEDVVVLKPGYSAFNETRLATLLRERNVDALALAGTATEMCVFQTATDALRSGFAVSVLAQACATIDEEHEALALEYLERVLDVPVLGRDGVSSSLPLGSRGAKGGR